MSRRRASNQLSAENVGLARVVAEAQGRPASDEAFRALLRLRGEIGVLRRTAGEADQLRRANQQLAAAPASASRDLSAAPPDRPILARWPKGQLAFAGYADPAAALETALSAMSRRDAVLLAASVTPAAGKRMTREDWGTQAHGSPGEEIAASTKNIQDSLAPSDAFCLLGQKLTSPDRAILDVYFEGEGKTRKFRLDNIGAEWKLQAMGAAGGGDDFDAGGWP